MKFGPNPTAASLWTFTLLAVELLHICSASWWLLAMPSAYQQTLQLNQDYKSDCKRLNYLVERQRELCTLSKNMLTIVSKGAQMGLQECQHQFAGRRWNCSTQVDSVVPHLLPNNTSAPTVSPRSRQDGMQSDAPAGANEVGDVFGGILKFHSREKAYVHAVSAAGVAFSITRACSQGELPSCSCDRHVHLKHQNKGQWEWGGCSEDISYGERLSRDFVDSNELVRPWTDAAPKLMNLWNNEAGRRSLRNNVDIVCKCHGVSGSCTVKICWRRLLEFRQIGESLYRRFNGAARVQFAPQKRKLKPSARDLKKPSKRDLVYLQESPDYCEENSKFGIVGTRGRKCQKDSYGMDGCSLMCCGRGYHTLMVEKVTDCNCKFVWCCEVRCAKCKESVEENFCN